MELKCEKLVNDSKNVKTELNKVKNENKKILRSKQPSKKVLVPNPKPKASEITDKEKSVDAENDSNQNLQPAVAKCVTTTPIQLQGVSKKNVTMFVVKTPTPTQLNPNLT